VGIVFKNNAKTTLSSAVNNSTTTIPVTDGSVFPVADLAGAGTFFLLTLEEDGNSPAIEIVKVTTCSGASGNINLTVVRAQEGTSATAFDSGDKAELRFTSGTIDHIRSDNTVYTNIFTTANASTTAFTLNQAVTDENDLVVFIDGVFQAHNTYTVSGTTLTLATAPASGRVVTAYSIKGLRSATNVAIATMTGDNSDTTLTLPIEPVNENSVQVFFDGVYQNKSTFSVSGTTLTFSTAPPTGVEVEAILLTQTNIDTAAILKDADGDTKVQVEESSDEDTIRMDIAGTEVLTLTNSAMTLKGSGPVFTIGDGDAEDIKIIFDGNTQDFYIGLDDSADSLTLGRGTSVGASKAIVIDATGKVGINVTPTSALDLEIETDKRITFAGNIGEIGDVAGFQSINSAGSALGAFGIRADDIRFATGSSERMRIDSSGALLIGTTNNSITADVGVKIRSDSSTAPYMGFVLNTSSSAHGNYFHYNLNSTFNGYRFYVFNNGGIANYSANNSNLSDERVKSNIEVSGNYLQKICDIPVKYFNYKDEPEDKERSLGVIAQDVEAIAPELVNNEGFGETPEDGVPLKTVYTTDMMYALMKAIQEQQTIIDDLKTRIEVLEE
tara:strand:- start:1140 stop:2978 length:1839 start_codon:yes stop_codon:yes gene_type:complete